MTISREQADGSTSTDAVVVAPPRAARGRPPRVSLDEIVTCAHEIGLAELTMAAVARKLGVGPATLYGHVRDFDSLRHKVATDLLMLLDVEADGDLDPVDLLVAVGTRFNDLLGSNPGLAQYLSAREMPAYTPHHERIIELLVERGLPVQGARVLAEDLPAFVIGYESGFVPWIETTVGSSELVVDAYDEAPHVDDARIFEWTLRAHVRGLVDAIVRDDLPWSTAR